MFTTLQAGLGIDGIGTTGEKQLVAAMIFVKHTPTAAATPLGFGPPFGLALALDFGALSFSDGSDLGEFGAELASDGAADSSLTCLNLQFFPCLHVPFR